jgi:hypothetical protein
MKKNNVSKLTISQVNPADQRVIIRGNRRLFKYINGRIARKAAMNRGVNVVNLLFDPTIEKVDVSR